MLIDPGPLCSPQPPPPYPFFFLRRAGPPPSVFRRQAPPLGQHAYAGLPLVGRIFYPNTQFPLELEDLPPSRPSPPLPTAGRLAHRNEAPSSPPGPPWLIRHTVTFLKRPAARVPSSPLELARDLLLHQRPLVTGLFPADNPRSILSDSG